LIRLVLEEYLDYYSRSHSRSESFIARESD